MKKIILALVVLVIAAPALARVDVTCEQAVLGEPNVTVSYDNGEAEPVRAFALEITLDAGEISAISCLSDDYYLYPGSINIIDGEVEDFGSCVAFIDSNVVIIEMGSLYADEDPCHTTPPPDEDDLLLVTVTEACQMCITENELRGGVVMEDLSAVDVNAPCCVIALNPNEGTCWDNTNECGGQPLGDASCDGFINFLDLFALKASVFKCKGQPGYNCCADFDHSGCVNFADLFLMKAWIFTVGYTPATLEQSCPP